MKSEQYYCMDNKRRRNSKFRLQLQKNATKEELIFKEFLQYIGVSFTFQKGFLSPYHRICDFYIKKYRLIVEIDGGYHCDTKAEDAQKDQVWGRFRTLRLTNEQVLNQSYIRIFNDFIKQ